MFPVIQTCEKGETAWTEVPAAGQAEDELDHPAPSFLVTGATGEDAHGAATEQSSDASTTEHTAPAASTTTADDDCDGGSNGLAITGLVAGLLGLVLGGAALLRTRGRTQA